MTDDRDPTPDRDVVAWMNHMMEMKQITQKALEDKCGVKQGTISRILRGKITNASHANITRMTEAINAWEFPDATAKSPPSIPRTPRADINWGIQIAPPSLAAWAPDTLRAYVAANAQNVLAADPSARDHFHFAVKIGTDPRMQQVWQSLRDKGVEDSVAKILPEAIATASLYGRIEIDKNPVGAQVMARWQLIHELKHLLSATDITDDALDVLSLIAIGR